MMREYINKSNTNYRIP
jgi:hypothetical protein